ncbi:hypothetical protein DJ533_13910 [Acinetobacter defluvii]|uniref:Uncharacterized protein n=1 Tax=Acinetobacter defluvii TaxID=1871111 RepID=A0A2S2FF42_9GAMM|nr:hypothetical protein [Acinetobacter defluvii]AWL29591.1 hypothetical protein DJ533_13910 [Acinetobacter defluvii]
MNIGITKRLQITSPPFHRHFIFHNELEQLCLITEVDIGMGMCSLGEVYVRNVLQIIRYVYAKPYAIFLIYRSLDKFSEKNNLTIKEDFHSFAQEHYLYSFKEFVCSEQVYQLHLNYFGFQSKQEYIQNCLTFINEFRKELSFFAAQRERRISR